MIAAVTAEASAKGSTFNRIAPVADLASGMFLAACLPLLLLIGCAGSSTQDRGDGGPTDGGQCRPTTCLAEGKNCGAMINGCGGTLECGTCSGGEICGGGGVTNVCGAPGSAYKLPPDRSTEWKPGVTLNGGIPQRSTVCATVDAATYGNGSQNASAAIQAALDACPDGQVVQLSAGTFTVNDLLLVHSPITLRGAGAGVTILRKTNGATPSCDANPPDAQPIVIVGPNRWPWANDATSQLLTADGAKGAFSVTISNAAGFVAGEFVLLDETSGASWQTDPLGQGQVMATPDFSIVWQLHSPGAVVDDPIAVATPSAANHWAGLGNGQDAASWFCRQDRPHAEVKEVASVAGNVLTFTTPLHTDFRTSHHAELTRYTDTSVHVAHAGVESLSVTGGSDGGIRFETAAYSWAKNVEVSTWVGEGFAVENSFRVEIRDSYVHDAACGSPGGGAYALSLSGGTADLLYENNINLMANKVMVARSSGAGSVIGYNYMDDGYIFYAEGWIETGINGSHMVGPHHMLFEGNYSFNFDSDDTHGSSSYHTVFRNWLRGTRRSYVNPTNGHTIDDATSPGNGPKRCGGAMAYTRNMSFVGNVMGAPGEMSGWVYDSSGPGAWNSSSIWMLGWTNNDTAWDPDTKATTLRDGNYDFVTMTQRWETNPGFTAQLPDSLYLTTKPAFFGTNPWPWVDPTTGTVHTLPAKARFDAGNPNGP